MTKQDDVKLDDIFAQIEEFEKTLLQLQDNLRTFREKLNKNKDKYGPDISKWPQSKD
jgi:vacuolar-type H+-ATPase subunit I/STV1